MQHGRYCHCVYVRRHVAGTPMSVNDRDEICGWSCDEHGQWWRRKCAGWQDEAGEDGEGQRWQNASSRGWGGGCLVGNSPVHLHELWCVIILFDRFHLVLFLLKTAKTRTLDFFCLLWCPLPFPSLFHVFVVLLETHKKNQQALSCPVPHPSPQMSPFSHLTAEDTKRENQASFCFIVQPNPFPPLLNMVTHITEKNCLLHSWTILHKYQSPHPPPPPPTHFGGGFK